MVINGAGLIINKYRPTFPACISQGTSAVFCVGYVNMVDQKAERDKGYLSDKIVILYNRAYYQIFIYSPTDAPVSCS